MNLSEIIEAWKIANNPNEKQINLSKARSEICDVCPKKTTKLGFIFCDECGCPIGKKIFTNRFNPCPLHKWYDSDAPYFPEQKNTKTLF